MQADPSTTAQVPARSSSAWSPDKERLRLRALRHLEFAAGYVALAIASARHAPEDARTINAAVGQLGGAVHQAALAVRQLHPPAPAADDAQSPDTMN